MYIFDAPDLGENKALIVHSLCNLFSLRTFVVTLLNESLYDIDMKESKCPLKVFGPFWTTEDHFWSVPFILGEIWDFRSDRCHLLSLGRPFWCYFELRKTNDFISSQAVQFPANEKLFPLLFLRQSLVNIVESKKKQLKCHLNGLLI